MGKPGAYLTIGRKEHDVRPAREALGDFDDFVVDLPIDAQQAQASRCMNCGVPFCQSGIAFNESRRASGCPLHNLIPETNDLFFRGRLDEAGKRLGLTNPFPEFTGRVCPAPCETSCNLGLKDAPVTIHDNERALSDYLWEQGIDPLPRPEADAPLASVVGSGPAGLAAAWELARYGARVRVYERDTRPGGLLMFGIPNMKLPKWVVERRVKLMEESGIEFRCDVDAVSIASDIASESAAVILACGARTARRLEVPGADLTGVHFALEYLAEATKALLEGRDATITAKGKDVAVIGGGDTGVDCVATALRQGARSVCQIVRASRPRDYADTPDTWPAPCDAFAQAYGQREAQALFGKDPRIWATDTVEFIGDGAGVEAAGAVGAGDTDCAGIVDDAIGAGCVSAVRVKPLPDGDAYEIPASLVLVAKGFIGPEQSVLDAFAGYGNVHVVGDARMGSTLVATAIADGLEVANRIIGELQSGSSTCGDYSTVRAI